MRKGEYEKRKVAQNPGGLGVDRCNTARQLTVKGEGPCWLLPTSFEGGRKTLNNYQKTKSQTNIHSDAESVNFREFIPKNSKKLVKNPPTNTENISSYLKRNSIKFNSNARLDTRNFRTTMLNKEKNVINDLSFQIGRAHV